MIRTFTFILFIFFSTKLLANEPEYSDSLNENRIKFGWSVRNLEVIRIGEAPAEIYTLTKGSYTLKCFIIYRANSLSTYCDLP